jgi:hypothetical protein
MGRSRRAKRTTRKRIPMHKQPLQQVFAQLIEWRLFIAGTRFFRVTSFGIFYIILHGIATVAGTSEWRLGVTFHLTHIILRNGFVFRT